LVEEFVCVKVLPLRANQSWFTVKDDEKYRARGLKGLGVDVKQAWSKVLRKSSTLAARVKVVYKKVVESVEELIGALGTTKNKAIKIALADRHRVNRCFDLLGLVYPDWPCVELKDAEGGKKRKRAEAGDKLMSMSKRGGHGCGRARGSMVDHVAMAKVAASSAASPVAAARPGTVISLEPRTSMVGGLYLVIKCQVFPSCLFCK
jgi:hypothetical protein